MTTSAGAGWASDAVDMHLDLGGRPRNVLAMTLNELNPVLARLDGIRAVARILKRDERTIRRYSNGERALPADIAEEIRRLVPADCCNAAAE